MKKLLIAVAVMLSLTSVAKADPSIGVVVGVAVVSSLAGKFSPQILALKPAANLTDACKSKTVQAKGGTYSYVTFENCLK